MTIEEVITRVDESKPNNYDDGSKIKWLSELDWKIKKTIINKHIDGVEYNGYTEETPPDTELLAEKPFDVMYLSWLEAKIDYENQDIPRYNNDMSLHNTLFQDYANYYNKEHMSNLKTKIKVV